MISTVHIKGVSFVVEYDLTPACRGRRSSCGEPMEPDEAAEVELFSVRQDGTDEGSDVLCWISDDLSVLLKEACIVSADHRDRMAA